MLSTWVGLDFALCQCLCDGSVAFAIFSHCAGGNMEQNLPNLCTREVAHQAVFRFFLGFRLFFTGNRRLKIQYELGQECHSV